MALPIYLYTGPEFGLKNEAIDSLKASLKKKFGEVEEHLFYLVETPLNEVMNILENGTLFSDGICVVCKNAELITSKKKSELEMISSWLNSKPEQNTVLILVSDEVSVDKKLEALVPESNRQKFWEMFDDKKVPWLKSFFSKNGYELSSEAADLILEMVENNTQALKDECSRFFLCFPAGHQITADDVESVLVHNRQESPFTLFETASDNSINPQKRLETALQILQKIRLSSESQSASIIAGLTYCFRKLSLWHKICPNGYSADSFELKKNGFTSVLMQKQYKNAAKVWSLPQTTAILAILAATDAEIRSNGTFMEDLLLQKMLYEIVVKKGSRIAVYEE